MNPRFKQLVRLLALALVVILVLQTAAVACPTCKDGLASGDPERANLVRGYFWSILFMMSMPFLVLGGVGCYFYLLIRRARAARPPLRMAPAEQLLGSGPVPSGS